MLAQHQINIESTVFWVNTNISTIILIGLRSADCMEAPKCDAIASPIVKNSTDLTQILDSLDQCMPTYAISTQVSWNEVKQFGLDRWSIY